MDIETIKTRLESLGYTPVAGDDVGIQYAIINAEQYIMHFCNFLEIPSCLEHVWVDMACGYFLQTKQAIGKLTGIEIEPIVKRIQDGDTTVEYTSTTDREAAFNAFVENLINGHMACLLSHRKLRW